jgi:group I intron endonuclease
MKIAGIYQIQSKIKPDRIYIGSSNNVRRRWYRHLQQLRENKHHSSKLQYHYNKYGINDLVFIIKEPCFPEFLIIREQEYLDKLKPYFNSSLIAGSTLGYPAWNKGKKGIYTKEVLIKMSLAKKNKPLLEEHKNKIRNSCKGINTGKRSEETKLKMRQNSGRRGKPPWCAGKKNVFSKEALDKIRNARKKKVA